MQQTCLKCGHVRDGAGAPPAVQCPQCGAVYAKVEAAMAAKAARAQAATDAAVPGVATRPALTEQQRTAVASLLVLVFVVGLYLYFDRARPRAEATARPASVQALTGAEDAMRRRREAERQAEREHAARVEADRRAAMTPGERRREALQQQFSPWDGSHRAAEQAIQARMHNPRSYEHVQTTYVDRGPGRGITVHTRFRGTNSFNAVITTLAVVEVDEAGRVTAVRLDR